MTVPPVAPLSSGQQRLWLVDRLRPGGVEYLRPVAWRLAGALDAAALRRALTALVERHAVLRTRCVVSGGEPGQHADPVSRIPLAETVAPLAGGEEWVRDALAADLHKPFDLARDWPLRIRLFRMSAEDHVLLLMFHHIACDGQSLDILARDLGELYRAEVSGRPPDLPELPWSYADYAQRQRAAASGARAQADLDYWRGQLADLEPLELPADHARPAAWSAGGSTVVFRVSPEDAAALASLARRHGATPYLAALTVFLTLLARWTGRTDLSVGTPISGRTVRNVRDLIGFFVNTVVIRAELTGRMSFLEALDRVRSTFVAAYIHQEVPFERLVDDLASGRDLSRNPLFQIVFGMTGGHRDELRLPGLEAEEIGLLVDSPMFDLSLELCEERDGGLTGALNYATALFDQSTAERLAAHFRRVFTAAAADPDAPIARLPLLTAEEASAVLIAGQPPEVPRPSPCLPGLVARQAALTPEAIALTSGAGSLTYAELDAAANRLARYLRGLGLGIGHVVALALPRGQDLVVALLAVMRSGAAYLPLDPGHPRDRLEDAIGGAGAGTILTHRALAGHLGTPPVRRVVLDEPGTATAIAASRPDDPVVPVSPDDPAYVIFTSGSTGRPKGVVISHRGIRNHVLWAIRRHRLTPRDAMLHKTSIGFDAAAWEILAPLASGGRVITAPPGAELDPAVMAACIRRHDVTVLQLVPSVLRLFLENGALADCPTLRLITCAGEPLPLEACARLRQVSAASIVNTYGPTECSIDVTSWGYDDGETGSIAPLGEPNDNTIVRILGAEDELVPVGAIGEICAGGEGVAHGYAGQPRLTAERFVPDPFGATPGARLYRTGDLGRWRAGGLVEYLGRRDDQLKVRGVRIEPAEVEQALCAHPDVTAAVVLPAPAPDGSTRLNAYVTGYVTDVGAVRQALRSRLPRAMTPDIIVRVDRFPLTRNGKLDRRALLALDGTPAAARARVAPRTSLEQAVADAWIRVLGISRPGVHDGFFELGGNSLLATRVAFALADVLGREIPVSLIFQADTVASFAAALAANGAGAHPRPALTPRPRDGGPLPLSFAQQRLWLIDQLRGGDGCIVPTAWRITGPLDEAALSRALVQLVTRHEVLRTRIVASDGLPGQVVDPPGTVPVEILRAPDSADAFWQRRILEAAASRPFDLARQWPMRATLLRNGARDHVLLLAVHHIACDGWSLDVLARDLGMLYRAEVTPLPALVPELPVQYADFACWQRDALVGRALAEDLAYWRERLAGMEPTELPVDRERPAAWDSAGDVVVVQVPADLAVRLASLGRDRGATPYMTLLTVFLLLLVRRTGRADVAVGIPVAGRGRREIADLIGFFVNTLLIRTELSSGMSFAEAIDRVGVACREAHAHQNLPFERLVEELAPPRDLARNPLFQVQFEWQDTATEPLTLHGARTDVQDVSLYRVKFDLRLVLIDRQGGALNAVFEYATSLYDRATVVAVAEDFLHLVRAVAADPDAPVGAWRLLPGGAVPADDQRFRCRGIADRPGVPGGSSGHAEEGAAAGRGRNVRPCGAVPEHDHWPGAGVSAEADGPGAAGRDGGHAPQVPAAGAGHPMPRGAVPVQDQALVL